jgi:hypothetical protein
MRPTCSFFRRLIASFLAMTVLTSAIAMAAYVCPELAPAEETVVMEGMPCAEMDKDKPVHCAAFQSGAQLALEHLAAAPALAPVFTAFIMPASAPASPVALAPLQHMVLRPTGADPPYLRTQRLRI